MSCREAARECRRKKKEYVKCLENHVAVLENQNKTLIEELKLLKDIYKHKVEWSERLRGYSFVVSWMMVGLGDWCFLLIS